MVNQGVADGLAVYGFGYDSPEGGVYFQPAEISDDLSVIRLTLFGFSGHGAGLGTPQNLGNMPRPSDPFRAAELDIQRILHPPGGPADPTDPAVRAAIKTIFQDLLRSHVLPLADAAQTDPSMFEEALATGNRWSRAATIHLLLDGTFGEWGGELATEAAALESSLFLAYENAFRTADQQCRASGSISDLERLIELARIGLINFLDNRLDYILSAEGFCFRLEITNIDAPETIREGDTATVGFWIEPANLANVQTSDLAFLRVLAVFTPGDPNLVSTSPSHVGAPTMATLYETTITALGAVHGNDSEGSLTLEIDVPIFGLTLDTETITIDITPPPITCAGDPTTITETERIDIEVIWVTFDGVSTCEIHGEFEDQDVKMEDFPQAVIAFDIDRDGAGWDDEGAGVNWSRDSYGDDVAAGTYTLLVTHSGSGATFAMRFTVDITDSSADSVTMTVLDVSFAFVSP